jgi:hypothetical protein
MPRFYRLRNIAMTRLADDFDGQMAARMMWAGRQI